MRDIPLFFVLTALTFASAPVLAGPNEDAKLVLHVVPTETRRGGGCFSDLPEDAKDLSTAAKLHPQNYFAYVLITDFSIQRGLAGVQFGISYDDSVGRGVDITSWQNCALYQWEMENWPASGTGNLLTWDQAEDCQETAPLPVGFFFLTAYSEDRLKLIPRPVDGLARVAMCGLTVGRKTTLDNIKAENLGWIDFGKGPGYNPWDPEQNLLNIQKRFQPIKD
jgi:hypothetical protein